MDSLLSKTLIVIAIQISLSQWQSYYTYLTSNSIYTTETSSIAYSRSGSFVIPSSSYTTANFITCTTPATSYITLNKNSASAQYYSSWSFSGSNYFVSFDLYFQGTWAGQKVTFNLGTFSYVYTYTSPATYTLSSKFCDNLTYDIKTVNFTVSSTVSYFGNPQFTIQGTPTNQASLKNFVVSKVQCYPSCSQCTGPNQNECTSCYYGSVTAGVCPPCPSNLPFYMKSSGCKQVCQSSSARYAYGFCQYYNTYYFMSASFSSTPQYSDNLRWSILFDADHVDTSPTVSYVNSYVFGVMKYKAGVYRLISEISQSYYAAPVLIQIDAFFFNTMPVGCGLQFKINNTYYGSMYMSSTGLQFHRVQYYDTFNYGSCLTYTSCFSQELYLYVDIPQYQFLFSVVGNYTVATAGWGIRSLAVTTGYCPAYCQLCEVHFQCKTCIAGYYQYRDGTCTGSCSNQYQQLNGTYCQDYDDETPYSKYLIKEYQGNEGDPDYYAKYTLVSQNGTNFLKGTDIYYSFWQGYRVFGGPYVWAQAKFSRIFSIPDPHHRVTIGFYIIFGPTFPADGSFIYTIENNAPVTKLQTNYKLSYTDGKVVQVYEKIVHSTSSLQMQWECFGPNNEPLSSFCGVQYLYIAVHNCQPYCLSCTDQNNCLTWSNTYNPTIIKFSQADCLSNQYLEKETYTCQTCASQCLTCLSKAVCTSCQPTFQLTKLGCSCTYSQYELNNQCNNCPIECSQCLSSTYCIDCLNINNRKLDNGQCLCFDGYYAIIGNPVCLICNKFCSTCTGPTQNECLICKSIVNIQQTGTICQCPSGSYYEEIQNSCLSCHYSCLTCFSTAINNCLTCDSLANRTLKGLQCKCKPGYYELNQICTVCPTTEDSTLIDCYKNCPGQTQIWHAITCSSCDSGYQLILGECQPICGDLVILGYEQCEDGNNLLNDKCYNCQFQCPVNCLTCDVNTVFPCPDVCGDGYITGLEECEDGNTIPYDGCYQCKFQCQLSCTKCVKGLCQECATKGWYLDPSVTPWICKEKCGDGLVVGTEQCEDNNTSDLDGCKDCRYFCRLGCKECNYTNQTCLSCLNPGFTPQSYYCRNICGDGLLVTDPTGYFTEQCDDGNLTNLDGCSSSCTFQCQTIDICTSCLSNICQTCAVGFILNTAQNRCDPICRDGILVTLESCEDSLTLPYKCQNCKPKCQNSCITCSTNGLGCLSCAIGFQLIDNLCYSICGDKIKTYEEDCDDGNLIAEDGCHFCKYNCQTSCSDCYNGVCLNCFDGYQLINNRCFPICNDGIIAQQETCEFNNQLGYCNQCQLKCSQDCSVCIFGICTLCNPGFELNFALGNFYCVQILTQVSLPFDFCSTTLNNKCIQCQTNAYYDIYHDSCVQNTSIVDKCQAFGDFYCSECFENCIQCINNHCSLCDQGYQLNEEYLCKSFCGDGILTPDEQCEINDLNCQNCEFETPKNCINYLLDQCFTCEYGFYYNEVKKGCTSQCGDGIIVGEEQCEDPNQIPYDGCYECLYSCAENCQYCQYGICQKCQGQFYLFNNRCYEIGQLQFNCSLQCKLCYQDICLECNDQYILNEYNNCEKDCSPQCVHCVSKVCFQCSIGYYLLNNECLQILECQEGYYFDDNTFQCQAYCGDGIISKQEQCDDKNLNFDDDCYMCEYKCNEICIECIYGECYQCLKDYQLIDFKCYSKCQSSCIKCVDGICQQCQSQYYLDDYNLCQVIDCNYTFSCLDECGNGLKEKEEQCDDSNLEGIDECTNLCELSCEDNCEICVNGKCMICKIGYLISDYGCISNCGDSLVVGNEQCDDGNNIQFDGCFECQYQCCKHCVVCTKGLCQLCETQFELDQENNICNFIEKNEDNQMIQNCRTTSNKDCIECEKGKLDHISNICLIDNINECSSNCMTCRNSKCLECKEGYHGFQCRSYCGDGIITQLEECDDAIEYFDIDCFNCKINCPSNCQMCAFGVCSECRNGYYLDIISNSCSSICGDLILATDEVCDDGNDMRYDGCFQCQFQCQMECLDCQFGKCTLCVEPYILVVSKGICEEQIFCGGLAGLYYNLESNDCLPQCGDGIVAGNEQCEDNNSQQYDGCYECKYQCSLNCSNCQKGICQECKRGYRLDGQNCQIICGDGIKLKEEECDDGNDTIRDGCTNCKIDNNFQCLIKEELSFCFQCQQNCVECEENNNKIICKQCKKGYFLKDNTCIQCSEKCEECENTPNNCKVCSTEDCKLCEKNSGFYLDASTKKCISKCGDGIKAINEACDDGNQVDQDGCNQKCEVEKLFECDSNGCHIPPKKNIEIDYKNSTTTNEFDLFYEDLQFDVCDKLKIWIDRFDVKEFNYTIDKRNQSNQGKKNCQVGFNFFKTIEESNLIHILVPLVENVSRLIVEDKREIIIVPRKVVFYNEQQQAQAQSVAAASSTFTFLLQLIGPLTIILGGFNFFWTILDILTWINNFYFLNVDYPLNVKIFFNQLQWGDVINLPDVFSLNNPEDEYYFEAPVKFTEKEVNPLFMNNIQLFCGLILLTLLAYVLAMLYIKIYVLCFKKDIKVHKIEIFSINDMTKSIEIDQSMQQSSQKVNLKQNVPKVFEYVYKESFRFVTNFRAILISVINLVFLDICLACILQLQFTSTSQYTIVQFNILLSILGLFFIGGVFKLYQFVCSQHQCLYETELFSNNYSTLYEGINIKSSMALNYCFLNIIRKALFIFCTVYFYEIPLLQTTTCCLSCFLNLALVAYQNPFETRSILIQTAFPDLCIFFIIFMTILLAVHDVADIFSFDEKYFLGWIILFFIGLSIFVQLIFLFQEFFSNVKDRIKAIIDIICRKSNQQSDQKQK